MALPLEVFRLGPGKGWGVRCAADIPIGTLVSTYEGELLTSSEAEARRGADAYLFDLDHFCRVYCEADTTVSEKQLLPPLPFAATPEAEHLVIDARRAGNVARYFNHSCAPNMVVQPVLRQGDSGLAYAVALVAAANIPAWSELSYDYSYEINSVPGVALNCLCGAAGCRGRLI